MRVPNSDEFMQFIDFYANNRPDWARVPDSWLVKTPTLEELLDFFISIAECKDDLQKRKFQTEYVQWFREQTVYPKVKSLVLRKKSNRIKNQFPKLLNHREQAEKWTNGAHDAALVRVNLLRSPYGQYEKSDFFDVLDNTIDNIFLRDQHWDDVNAQIFFEYFHTEHHSLSIEMRPKIEKEIADSIDALKRLSNSLECVFSAASLRKSQPLININRHLTSITNRQEGLFPHWMNNPLRRRDPHSKEQLLVFRYWSVNRSWGSFKPNLVEELMYIEGVAHQYDLRTIERKYSEFTGAYLKDRSFFRRGGF